MQAQGTAQGTVAAGVEALGGERLLRGIGAVSIEGRGTVDRSAQIQGRRPGAPDPLWRRERLTADPAHQRAALEYSEPRDDGSIRNRRFSYAADEITVVDFTNRATSRGRFPDAARVRRELNRRVPHFLLLEALDHSETLRSLPDTTMVGVAYHRVEFSPSDEATPLILYFDLATAMLMRVGYVMDYPGFPAAHVELVYLPYAPRERLGSFPAGHKLLIEGRTLDSVRYGSVLTDDAGIESGFAIPEEIAAQQARGGAITQPAPGVYVVNDLSSFTAMFVEFKDFILAIEAPAEVYAEFDQLPVSELAPSSSVSDSLIARIHATVPGKPIRYVTVSHFHNDHSGGAPAFWADGATLLTTPGTRGYFEQFAVAAGRRAAGIETVAKRRVISDGTREAVLINVGPNGHTHEAMVVYLPRERILYQGDQFYYDGDSSFPPRDRLPVMRRFAAWLIASRLPVERIYGTHMRGYATMRHVRLMLALRSRSR